MKRFDPPAHPLDLLIAELRFAAANMSYVSARKRAAERADRVSESFIERRHTKKGEVAKSARAFMRTLPGLKPEDFAAAVMLARGYAAALDSPFTVIEETLRSRGETIDEFAAARTK